MFPTLAARSFVLFLFALTIVGCVADTRRYPAECRCVVETGGEVYDLPCGVQACLDGVGVECRSAEEARPIDIACDDDETAIEEGVCEGQPDFCGSYYGTTDCPAHCDINLISIYFYCAEPATPVRCEDQRGEWECEGVKGCSWEPAPCSYSENGCAGSDEESAATEEDAVP